MAFALYLLACAWPHPANAQAKRYVWAGYARTPQHDARADIGAQ